MFSALNLAIILVCQPCLAAHEELSTNPAYAHAIFAHDLHEYSSLQMLRKQPTITSFLHYLAEDCTLLNHSGYIVLYMSHSDGPDGQEANKVDILPATRVPLLLILEGGVKHTS